MHSSSSNPQLSTPPPEAPLVSEGLADLLTAEQEDLLDKIDRLRSLGVSGYIDLPQLVVCGDQSSGKSSVLEYVFPESYGLRLIPFPLPFPLPQGSV